MPEESANAPRGRSAVLLVFATVLTGLFLRVYDLDRLSMWIDEIWTMRRVSKPSAFAVVRDLQGWPFPPLYYVTLYGWSKVFGTSDIAFRSLSATVGAISLPITYFMWRGLLGARASRVALVLLSLNAYHIFYSRDAKMYVTVWLLATISSASFLHLLLNSRHRIPWVLSYLLSTGALPLVSYVGAAPLVAQAVYGIGLVCVDRTKLRRLVVVAIVASISLMPLMLWLPNAVDAAKNQSGIGWVPAPQVEELPRDFVNVVGAFLVGYQMFDLEPAGMFGWVLVVLFYCAVLWVLFLIARLVWCVACSAKPFSHYQRRLESGAGSLMNPDRKGSLLAPLDRRSSMDWTVRSTIVFLAVWFMVPIILCIQYSFVYHSLWGVPRYLSGVAPALLLLTAVVIACAGPRVGLVTAGLVMSANIGILTFSSVSATRAPWREIARVYLNASASLSFTTPRGSDMKDKKAFSVPSGIVGESNSYEKRRKAPHDAMLHSSGFHNELDITWVYQKHQRTKPIDHAFRTIVVTRHRDLPIRHRFVETAIESKRPFVAINWPGWGHTHMHRAPIRNGWRRHLCYAVAVHEEPYTALPTPFETRRIEVWRFSPR